MEKSKKAAIRAILDSTDFILIAKNESGEKQTVIDCSPGFIGDASISLAGEYAGALIQRGKHKEAIKTLTRAESLAYEN